ncbi:MAG: VanZ family protein [Rhodococcus sp.]|nr:VanZ family protein [Rhodococcus sp. (in: high G+C Gram-positive bacteria)]
MTPRRIPVVVASVVVLVMLLSPASSTPTGPEHADKVVHALMFAVLAGASLYGRISPTMTAVWLIVFAAATELAQAVLPIGRHGSLWDFAADVGGVVIVLAVAWLVRRSTRTEQA